MFGSAGPMTTPEPCVCVAQSRLNSYSFKRFYQKPSMGKGWKGVGGGGRGNEGGEREEGRGEGRRVHRALCTLRTLSCIVHTYLGDVVLFPRNLGKGCSTSELCSFTVVGLYRQPCHHVRHTSQGWPGMQSGRNIWQEKASKRKRANKVPLVDSCNSATVLQHHRSILDTLALHFLLV